MPKYAGLVVCLVLAGRIMALADYVSFESNNFEEQRIIHWTGVLESVDGEGLAHFWYYNHGHKQTFTIHRSRLYSVEFNNSNTVNRKFPETRADLTTRLARRMAERVIELEVGCLQDIDQDDANCLKATKGERILGVSGSLVSLVEGKVRLRLRSSRGKEQCTPPDTRDVELDASELVTWMDSRQ